ncbi:MAG: hypothetical protein RL672_797 [Actinomycetota bacterium]|jgi:hypothetical protein
MVKRPDETPAEREARLLAEAEAEVDAAIAHQHQEEIAAKPDPADLKIGILGKVLGAMFRSAGG